MSFNLSRKVEENWHFLGVSLRLVPCHVSSGSISMQTSSGHQTLAQIPLLPKPCNPYSRHASWPSFRLLRPKPQSPARPLSHSPRAVL